MNVPNVRDFLKEWVQERGYYPEALRLYGEGQPKVIMFGEDHRSSQWQWPDQLDLCARLNSSHFLHEDFRNLVYERQTKILKEAFFIGI